MPTSSYSPDSTCGCCSGLWRPSWGRDRILPGDTGRSWFFTNPAKFSALRCGLAFIGIAYLVYSAATDKPPPAPQEPASFAQGWFAYWKFYSHWTLALCTLYCIIASLFAYALWKHEKNPPRRENVPTHFSWEMEVQVAHEHAEDVPVELEDTLPVPIRRHNHHRRISFGELCIWFLYQTVWAAAIFCASTFWLFIGIGCLPRRGCTKVNSHFWMAQVLNLLFIGTELFFNKLPFLPMHSILTFGYCVLWLVFSAILFFVTGQWVYPHNSGHGQLYSAVTFWPGWIVLNVASFFIGFVIEWGVSRFIPNKHSIASVHTSAPLRAELGLVTQEPHSVQ